MAQTRSTGHSTGQLLLCPSLPSPGDAGLRLRHPCHGCRRSGSANGCNSGSVALRSCLSHSTSTRGHAATSAWAPNPQSPCRPDPFASQEGCQLQVAAIGQEIARRRNRSCLTAQLALMFAVCRDSSRPRGTASSPTDITDAETAAMLRAFFNLAQRWKLNDREGRILLGWPAAPNLRSLEGRPDSSLPHLTRHPRAPLSDDGHSQRASLHVPGPVSRLHLVAQAKPCVRRRDRPQPASRRFHPRSGGSSSLPRHGTRRLVIPDIIRVRWPRTYRLVRSIYPPVDLFEDIADPADWELIAGRPSQDQTRGCATRWAQSTWCRRKDACRDRAPVGRWPPSATYPETGRAASATAPTASTTPATASKSHWRKRCSISTASCRQPPRSPPPRITVSLSAVWMRTSTTCAARWPSTPSSTRTITRPRGPSRVLRDGHASNGIVYPSVRHPAGRGRGGLLARCGWHPRPRQAPVLSLGRTPRRCMADIWR